MQQNVQAQTNTLTRNVVSYGVLPFLAVTAMSANAAEGDLVSTVTTAIGTFTSQGTLAITAIAAGLFTLAGVALLVKWVKAAFFS